MSKRSDFDLDSKKTSRTKENMGFLSLWHSLLFWTLIVLSLKTLNTVKMKSGFTVLAGSPRG